MNPDRQNPASKTSSDDVNVDAKINDQIPFKYDQASFGMNQLYSFQFANPLGYGQPTFHLLPDGSGSLIAQVMANIFNNAVRMTRCNSIHDDVSRYSGNYFNPKNI